MTTTADRIAAALRPIAPQGKLLAPDVPLIDRMAAQWDARLPAVTPTPDPEWIVAGRKYIGQREIKGPKHNDWIAAGWAKLGAGWFNDDETPWCGYFVARCLDDAGLPYPRNFPAAASFRTWGTACPAQLGAIGVKARSGGNHVFFIVGQTPDGRHYKVLEGNANDMVRIGDIARSVVTDIRWPQGAPLPARAALYLPTLPAGVVASSEA